MRCATVANGISRAWAAMLRIDRLEEAMYGKEYEAMYGKKYDATD